MEAIHPLRQTLPMASVRLVIVNYDENYHNPPATSTLLSQVSYMDFLQCRIGHMVPPPYVMK